MSQSEMMEALHPDPNKNGTRVTKATFEAYREAILKVIPTDDEGIQFVDLSKAAEPHVSKELLENTSIGWWTTVVKLDLEARGIIERVPGKGRQRVRRLK
ncbi:MAG: hypothetical protein AAF490_24415 [Chloroflexota bacterium]